MSAAVVSAAGWAGVSAAPPPRDSFSPGSATRAPAPVPAPAFSASGALGSSVAVALVRLVRRRGGRSVFSSLSGRRRRRRGVTPDSLSGTSVIERSPSEATRRPLRAPFSTLATVVMSMKTSATSIKSLLVLPRKLMTSTRVPICCTAAMAGAKSPSPETTTATSSLSPMRIMSTTSSMSRFALMRPSPYLRMSLLTTL